MKRILAYPQGTGNAVELECENTAIEWSMSATDMGKPTRRKSSHSLNFVLPFSHTNNQFFKHFYEVNATSNTWSHQARTRVVVYDDIDEVFEGSLQLMSVNVFRSQYECVIIGDAGSFFTAIRKMTWSYLFTNDEVTTTILDHLVSMTNVSNSWNVANDITGGAGNGTIVYVIADNAEYPSEGYEFMTASGLELLSPSSNGSPTPIVPQYCRPTIKVKWLWDYIFAKAGYTYESSFFDTTDFGKLYMVLGTEKENLPLRALYRAKVGLGADITPMTNNTYENLSFTIETGDYADPDNLVTAGNFVAPTSGTYQIIVQVQWVTATAPTAGVLHTSVRALVGTTPFVSTGYENVSTTAGSVVVMQYQWNLVLSSGQSVAFQAKHNTDATSPWYIESTGTYIQMGAYVTNNSYLDVVQAMPDMTCEQFMRGIISEFNLTMVSHNSIAKHLVVEPMQDYFTNYGQVRDWTHRVDLDKQITLRPTTEEQPKRITFEDAAGKDFRNNWWQDKFGWVKGRKRFDNSNDFAVDETNVGGVFAPFRLSPVPAGWNWYEEIGSEEFLILRLWSKKDGRVRSTTSPPMLTFYHGLKSTTETIYITGGTTISSVPFFSHLSESPATDNSINLRWGYDYPDFGNHPLVGISGRYKYISWYAAYLQSQYGEDSRILECEVWLNPEDVKSLTFADRIWIKDAYYRLYELSNYVIGENRSCKVKLWKVLDTTSYQCDLHPIGWQANGQVTFADETGTITPATAICCIAADYYWDDDQGVCLWDYNSQDGTGFTDVDPTTGTTNTGSPNPPIAPNGFQETSDPNTGVVGTGSTWGVFGTSSGASNVVLQTSFEQDTFYVPNDAVVMLEVQATTYQYDGTGGTIGDSSSVYQQFLLSTTGGLYRVLSNSVINTEGTARSLNLTLTGNGIGELQIEGVGVANVDLYWFGTINVVGMVIPEAYTPPVVVDVEGQWNGDTNLIQWNGVTGEYLIWNG